jgi:sec-independent protein translocase protein TatC
MTRTIGTILTRASGRRERVGPPPSGAPIIQKELEVTSLQTEEDARMSFTEHLGELRTRLVRSAIALAVAAVFCYIISDWLLDQLTIPLRGFEHGSVVVADDLPPADGTVAPPLEAEAEEGTRGEFTVLNPLEWIMMKFKVAGYGGLVLAFPFILYQLGAFIYPGLKPTERRLAGIFIFGCAILAVVGLGVAYAGVFPLVLPYLLAFTPDWVNVQLRMSETLSILIKGMLGFAIAFQFPMLVMVLVWLGLLTPATLKAYRKLAIVLMAVASSILTPPDPISLFIMLLPLVILYEASIWLSYLVVYRRNKSQAV